MVYADLYSRAYGEYTYSCRKVPTRKLITREFVSCSNILFVRRCTAVTQQHIKISVLSELHACIDCLGDAVS